MRSYILPLLSISLLALALGCACETDTSSICSPAADNSETMQTAGQFTVSQAEWDAELLSIPARARSRYDNDKAKQDLADRVILNKALFQDAKNAGIADENTVKIAARMAAEQVYIKEFFARLEQEAATEEQVRVYYQQNIDRYSRPEVRLRHILVKEESEARVLMAKLNAGDDFAALATEHTLDRASKPKGGELNWATKERYVPPFAEAAFALKKDEISAPVKTRFGYHLIQLLERRDVQPLDEVRPGIERVLVRDAVRDHRNARREELGLGKGARAKPETARRRNQAGGAPAEPGAPGAAGRQPQPK